MSVEVWKVVTFSVERIVWEPVLWLLGGMRFLPLSPGACCLSAHEGQAFRDGASSQSERMQTAVTEACAQQTCYQCHLVITPIDVDRVNLFTATWFRSPSTRPTPWPVLFVFLGFCSLVGSTTNQQPYFQKTMTVCFSTLTYFYLNIMNFNYINQYKLRNNELNRTELNVQFHFL